MHPSSVIDIQTSNIRNKPDYSFASIELLIEQEIGRIVLPQIYRNVGITINIQPLPGKRAQYVANSGVLDGEIMRIWSYGKDNLNTVRVPTPYYYLETMPFVLNSTNIKVHSIEELSNLRLTKVRGVKHTNIITRDVDELYDVSSTEDMFKLLLGKKVDVALTNTLDGHLVLKRLGLNNITPMKQPLATLPLYHYIHKKNKHLVPLIDAEIKRMKKNGELAYLIAAAEQHIFKVNQ